MTDQAPPNSRYYGVEVRTRTGADGTVQTFLARRIIPATQRYRPLDRYRVTGHERIDALAESAFGDPEQYWRICDANGDQDPLDATTTEGRLLILPMPLEIADDGDT
jgi:hypothetical protein